MPHINLCRNLLVGTYFLKNAGHFAQTGVAASKFHHVGIQTWSMSSNWAMHQCISFSIKVCGKVMWCI